ncbi:MAG TPA: hypothetical protein VE641_10485 [Chthoniobacterales bacterium]|nr:hypothetical protein [Chthoniobacterales bacterium]
MPKIGKTQAKPGVKHNYLPPLQHLQPAARLQFGLGAILQYSSTPSLRLAGFDDEYENEAACEGLERFRLC